MEKITTKVTKLPKPYNIDLFFESDKDLIAISKDSDFKKVFVEEVYHAISKNMRKKTDKAVLITINNLELSVILEKQYYKTALNKVLQYYTLIENYEECIKIEKLINKL